MVITLHWNYPELRRIRINKIIFKFSKKFFYPTKSKSLQKSLNFDGYIFWYFLFKKFDGLRKKVRIELKLFISQCSTRNVFSPLRWFSKPAEVIKCLKTHKKLQHRSIWKSMRDFSCNFVCYSIINRGIKTNPPASEACRDMVNTYLGMGTYIRLPIS